MATHDRFSRAVMCKVWFYDTDSDEILMRVENRSSEPLKCFSSITLSESEYCERPQDPYDDVVEARWAFNKFGLSID